MRLPVVPLLLLAACSEPKVADDNHATPPIEVITEQPGDWSALDLLVGKTPAVSGLLSNSPVTTDLNALLGPDLAAFRAAMAMAGPLRREGPRLVTEAPGAWLVLDPAATTLRAGLRPEDGRWREWRTAGSDLPAPR